MAAVQENSKGKREIILIFKYLRTGIQFNDKFSMQSGGWDEIDEYVVKSKTKKKIDWL